MAIFQNGILLIEGNYMDTTERKIKILIVDDDKTTRDTLSFLLTRKGFTTEKSENGKQALEKI